MAPTTNSIVQTLLLGLPFLLIAWISWVRSIQQEQRNFVRPSLMQRDAERARTAIARRNGRGRRAFQKQPTADIPIVDAAPIEAAATATAPTVKAAAAPVSGCSPDRKPFHTVLTATAQVYQQWQCRVMYFQWKKQRRNDPVGTRCTEMTGFTRLVAHGNGEPDGLEGEIPSYFVNEYSSQDYQRFHGYRVINRPYSVVQFLKSDYYKNKIAEDYVFIAETDHILTQPLPNKASLGKEEQRQQHAYTTHHSTTHHSPLSPLLTTHQTHHSPLTTPLPFPCVYRLPNGVHLQLHGAQPGACEDNREGVAQRRFHRLEARAIDRTVASAAA
jgi:hypothetical protein